MIVISLVFDHTWSPTNGRSDRDQKLIEASPSDRVQVQLPVLEIYISKQPDTQVNSAWPSLRG